MLAQSLRIQLKDYLGGGPKSVSLFEYDEDKQTYTPANHEFEATSMNQDYKWFLAYGVTLERQPNAFPKTTFQFPVWFTWDDTELTIDTSFGVVKDPRQDPIELTNVCERIYNGLCKSIENRIMHKAGTKKFGFLGFDK